jgi:hypothetical protein
MGIKDEPKPRPASAHHLVANELRLVREHPVADMLSQSIEKRSRCGKVSHMNVNVV